jgi:hypothetical protein
MSQGTDIQTPAKAKMSFVGSKKRTTYEERDKEIELPNQPDETLQNISVKKSKLTETKEDQK